MNSVDNISNEDNVKLQKLWAIFGIVDRKYEIEHDLRPLSLVQKWIKDEIAEVMAEVVRWDDAGRRDEVWDLIYVTYAAKKWRTAGSHEDLLKIFKWHSSFMKYFNELSVEDFEHTFEKFRGRNEYLFDEDFLEVLNGETSCTRRLDMIDRYWDIIKYKKQKWFKSALYKVFLRKYDEILWMFESDMQDEWKIVPVWYYDGLVHNTISSEYLREKLESLWLSESMITQVARSFTYYWENIEKFVDLIEIHELKWLSPVDAFISAALISPINANRVVILTNLLSLNIGRPYIETIFRMQNIQSAHIFLAITHLKWWPLEIVEELSVSWSYEFYLILSYMVQSWVWI